MAKDLIGENLRELLQPLHPETQPKWGRMTPQHMVEHLSSSIRMSNGKKKFLIQTPPEKLAGLKAFLLSNRSFPKNFHLAGSSPELPALRQPHLAAAILELEQELTLFRAHFNQQPNRIETHPIFGELTQPEWEHFHRWHFTHHFTQFGLL
jgi:hypothetical protein